MSASPTLTEAPPLTPAMYHILLALLDGDRHGYAIMQSVEVLSQGSMRLGPGTLYASIRKMLDARLIEETESRTPDDDDERRRYYRLAQAGRAAAAAETRRLSRLVQYATKHSRAV